MSAIIAPVSIATISAFNLECGRVAIVLRVSDQGIVLKSYNDGSGKTEAPNGRFVTLAAYSATNETWKKFENHWQSVLNKHSIEYFHIADAMAGRPPFDREKGWGPDKAMCAAIELIAPLTSIPDSDLVAFACTVEIEGYKKAYEVLGKDIGPLEAICADWCFGGLLSRLHKNEDGSWAPIEAFFDRNEEFLRWVDRVWRSHHAIKRFEWPALVTTVAPVCMKQVKPIQAADIAAWTVRDFYETGHQTLLHQVLVFGPGGPKRFIERCYRFDDIVEKYRKRPWCWMNSREYKRFDTMMQRLIRVPHSELQAKLAAEKQAKETRKNRKSKTSVSGRDSREQD